MEQKLYEIACDSLFILQGSDLLRRLAELENTCERHVCAFHGLELIHYTRRFLASVSPFDLLV